jgi:hypothetical protein
MKKGQVMRPSTLHRRALQVLFRGVERFCELHPRPKKRTGRTATCSGSLILILKLMLLGYLWRLRGETAILRHAERHYRRHLEPLPSQSHFWLRWRTTAGCIEQFRRSPIARLAVHLEHGRIVDIIPVSVCKFFRPRRHRGLVEADWGYCPSKHWHFHGFKVGRCLTTPGIPDFYDMFHARLHDVNLRQTLVTQSRD